MVQYIEKNIYEPLGLMMCNVREQEESKEYGACTFEVNGKQILFRIAKITPTKKGQFVTLWKRIGRGPIMPYDTSDTFDFFVVHVCTDKNIGQFIFPKDVLYARGVISHLGKGGKRAIRVYPKWDSVDNKQAKATQEWQLKYFFDMDAVKNAFLKFNED